MPFFTALPQFFCLLNFPFLCCRWRCLQERTAWLGSPSRSTATSSCPTSMTSAGRDSYVTSPLPRAGLATRHIAPSWQPSASTSAGCSEQRKAAARAAGGSVFASWTAWRLTPWTPCWSSPTLPRLPSPAPGWETCCEALNFWASSA